MKKRTFRLAAAALALALTGCAAADTSTAAQIEMRVQDGYIQYYNGTDWENLISTEELKGEKGDKGDPGEKGERGEIGPQGAKGDKGDPGTNGINGQNGTDGANGKDGANGQNGTNGKNGVDGKNGADGKDGVDGKDGRDGVDGLNGKDGVDGKDGRDGVDGKDGRNGVDGKDGKDGIDGKDGRDGVDGKDGISSVPGIMKNLRASIYNYYNFFDYDSVCGHLEIDDVEKAVIDDQSFWEKDSSKLKHISFLMNEDGQLSLTAVAEPGWSFVKWDDDVTTPSRTITYTDDSGLIAYFAPTDPTLSWDNIKPFYHCSAALVHSYSYSEPWIDIKYACNDASYTSNTQNTLGEGRLASKGEDSTFGKYIDIEHSVTTTVRYGNLSAYPSENIGTYIYGTSVLSLTTVNESATLRIQILQDGSPVDPETVLPPLSTVDWLQQGE